MREVETKFDVAPDFLMPDLSSFATKSGTVDVDEVPVSSSYHDTAAMDLLRFRLTLRRRTGGADTGWQLKVPGAGFRTELHWPADGDTPPDGVRTLLAPFLRGVEPVPAVRLDVQRTRHRLCDAAGTLLAEVAQDDVRATALEVAVRAAHWQEAEVELGPAGDAGLQKQLGRALLKAGAYPSTSRSKLARAVRGVGAEPAASPESAGGVLGAYIDQQIDAIVAGHFAIEQDAPESIHQTRVACRRLRSTLKTFHAFFDPAAVERLEEELSWYAAVLGEVRDREVLRERLAATVAELPPELVVGPVAASIDATLANELVEQREAVLLVQAGERYADLLAALAGLREEPPFTAAAGRAAHALQKPLKHAEKKLRSRLSAATAAAGTDADMHSARKAGKRARYAAEAVESEKSAFVKQTKALQDLLGDFQDSVVAAGVLLRLAGYARERGEDTFTYGVLVAAQHSTAAAIRAQAKTR
jgi:CHAD domain-containing protein